MYSSTKTSSVLLALMTGLLLTISGCKKEITMQFSECPVIVQNALTTNMPGVTFTKVEQETQSGGIVIYEAKGKQADGKEVEVKVTGDGSLVKIDR